MTWWAYNADRCGAVKISQAIPLQLPVHCQPSCHILSCSHLVLSLTPPSSYSIMPSCGTKYTSCSTYSTPLSVDVSYHIMNQAKPIMSCLVSLPHSPRPRPWTRSPHHCRIRPGYLCLNHPVPVPQRTLIMHRHRHRHHCHHCRQRCRHLRTS